MYHEYDIVILDNVDNLQQSVSLATSPYKPLILTLVGRIRRIGVADHIFGFVRRDTMVTCVLDIPFIPSELDV